MAAESTVSGEGQGGIPEFPEPSPRLNALDVMLGVWELEGREFGSGGPITGRLTLEKMDGDFYVVQHVEVNYPGMATTGTEYIGYDQESDNLKGTFYSNQGPGPFGGIALEYVWEVEADTITIWGGFVGSPANFKGTLNEDRSVISGRWEWPGGGYEATVSRAS